eukprot:TRINITY_DN16153_c0_g1_i1.p1 TRINITY_DN16153_c0_g1~~TRINITY_DN16153_c0_g1_i1.p1  ORF type:complete len:126 (-),score=24.79 TRINITY_DN16153_c0_g1_i1:68-445(-)
MHQISEEVLTKTIPIKIKPIVSEDKSICIDVLTSDDIKTLKTKIHETFGCPMEYQVLSINDEIIDDNTIISTIPNNKIDEPLKITLSFALAGGCGHKICGCYWWGPCCKYEAKSGRDWWGICVIN